MTTATLTTVSSINPVDILRQKREGQSLTRDDIRGFVAGMMYGSVPDYQVSALLMAICINGMNLDEATWLTEAFVDSGDRLDTEAIKGIVVDKHSTGGVGDKATLVLVPLLAACGLKVAKLSGRGLGFTGGTIDKLEAIPGFQTALDNDALIAQVNDIGMAISSQTPNLAPADGHMYALRDVTATVDNIPLIAASVVSKKIATGADVVVLDIKVGQGAFMKDLKSAEELAYWCREIGQRLGKTFCTVITRMDEPLGNAVGHTLEVLETLDTLQGKGPEDLIAVVDTLGGLALKAAGIAATLEEGKERIAEKRINGQGFEAFKKLVMAQGGDENALLSTHHLPQPERIRIFPAEKAGVIQRIDALKIAHATKVLGAGRNTKADVIDLGVGIRLLKQIGERVDAGDALVELHSSGKGEADAVALLQEAIVIEEQPANRTDVIVAVN
jgi:pyrimidine-nucleoside phosphorylase